MDKIKNSIMKLVKAYIDKLNENNLYIEKAVLFGSYVKGNYKEFSDIDIALISKEFTGIRFLDREKIVPLRRKIDNRIEPMPFRPEDFTKDNPFANEIITNGIIIS